MKKRCKLKTQENEALDGNPENRTKYSNNQNLKQKGIHIKGK